MSRRLSARGVSLSLVGALLLAAMPASADVTKDQCIDSNAKAQDLRRDHKLSLAREQLTLCADAACPSIVRNDCVRRLGELEEVQPSVLFDVTDAAGALVPGVKVTVDGKPLVHTDPGTSVALDPGEHSATYEAPGFTPVTQTVVMIEGDKGHHEHVVLSLAAPARPVAPTPAPPADHGGASTQKLLGLVAGGVGLAGIVVGSVFGAMTLSEKSDQVSVCGSPCGVTAHQQAENDHSSGITDSAVATTGFVAGAALLAGGAILYFTAHPSTERPASLGWSLVPTAGPGSGGVVAVGKF